MDVAYIAGQDDDIELDIGTGSKGANSR